MKKLQSLNCNNESNSSSCFMPLHNALGLEYWPQYVQDDHVRLYPRKSDFVPIEELLVADFEGRHWLIDNQEQEEFLADGENQEIYQGAAAICQSENADDEEDCLDTLEKCRDYYRTMYPWLFPEKIGIDHQGGQSIIIEQPRFHGRTRQSITPKSELRAKPNSKRKRIKYLSIRRDTIRTAYFDNLLAESEKAAEADFLNNSFVPPPVEMSDGV